MIAAWAEFLCLAPLEAERDQYRALDRMVRRKAWHRLPRLMLLTTFHEGLTRWWFDTDIEVVLFTQWKGAEKVIEDVCGFRTVSVTTINAALIAHRVDRLYHPYAQPLLGGSFGRMASPNHYPER